MMPVCATRRGVSYTHLAPLKVVLAVLELVAGCLSLVTKQNTVDIGVCARTTYVTGVGDDGVAAGGWLLTTFWVQLHLTHTHTHTHSL